MAKGTKIEEPTTKILWRIEDSTLRVLAECFAGSGRIGVNRAVRVILRSWVRQNDAEVRASIDQIERELSP